jgi:UDP-galactopyranose mutase
MLRILIDELFAQHRINSYCLWYYAPMWLNCTRHLDPLVTVYDCMTEVSAAEGASAEFLECEDELLRRADLVFTAGVDLYESKRKLHPDVYLFPSNIDGVFAADEPHRFVGRVEPLTARDLPKYSRLVDSRFSSSSWSCTWRRMSELVDDAIHRRCHPPPVRSSVAP